MSLSRTQATPAANSQKMSGMLKSPTTGLLSSSFAVMRPYTPRIIPLLVYATFFPLIIIVSLGAGYFVWSSLSISWNVPLYLQYGDGVSPYAHVELPQLMLQQRYAISVDLQLPATEMNLALGNFMTSILMLSPKNETLAYVRRPAIVLEPPSSWLYGKPRTIHMNVPLLDYFVFTSSNLAATVQIGRADSWSAIGAGQGREVNILFASLKGLVIPHGIRGLAVRFPFISAAAAAFIFFFILCLIPAMWILPLVTDVREEPVPIPQDIKVKMERKRSISDTGVPRRRSGSSQWEDISMVQAESPEVVIPLTEEPLRMLRRRSSRPSMASSELET